MSVSRQKPTLRPYSQPLEEVGPQRTYPRILAAKQAPIRISVGHARMPYCQALYAQPVGSAFAKEGFVTHTIISFSSGGSCLFGDGGNRITGFTNDAVEFAAR